MKRFIALIAVCIFCIYGCNKVPQNNPAPLALMVAPTAQNSDPVVSEAEYSQGKVYVCVSAGAKRYHLKESCHGLARCTHKIEQTTVKKAEASGLTLCKYED